jgi:PAS domain S-box-containing protein
MANEPTNNAREHEKIPVWRNKSFWHITGLMVACSVFYYMDVIIDFKGWVSLRYEIFYTVHDLHRALFLIPVMYATYEFRMKGIIITSFLSLLVFLPRALVVSPYSDPLLRALIFIISIVGLGVLLSLLLNSTDESKKLKKSLGQAQDELQRKRTEDELEKERLFANTLLDSLPGIFYLQEFDPMPLVVRWNKNAEKVTGFTPEEIFRRPAMDFLSPETQEIAMKAIQKAMEEGYAQTETGLVTKDGRTIPYIMTTARLESSGKPRFMGIGIDISARKQAETALRESEEKYRSITENMSDGISELDPQGIIKYISPSIERILGYNKEELIGSSAFDLVHPEDRDLVISTYMDGVKTQSERNMEQRYKRKDGTYIWLRSSGRPLYGSDGKAIGMIVNSNIITERKHVENLMSMQSEVLKILISDRPAQQTVEEIVDLIKQATGLDAVGVRLRSGDDYPFVASLGYSEEFLKAENTLTYNYPDGGLCRNDDGTISLECTCGMIISGKSDPDNPLLTPGGSFWTNNSLLFLDVPPEADPRLHPRNRCIHVGFLSLALIPIRAGAEVIGLLHLADRNQNSFTPVTIPFYEGIGISIGVALSRKRAKEEIIRLNKELGNKVNERTSDLHNTQLALLNLVDDLNQSVKSTALANRKLEETNNELKAFSYSVSHDLRAPLRSIDGFSLALLEDYQEKLDDTGRNYLNKIRAATQHMGLLIEDLLKLSRVTHAEFQIQSIDLSKIAQLISETFQQNNPEKDIKMTIQKGMIINGDFNYMEIALTNLLENALKFTGKQKKPLIEFGMTLTEGKTIFFIRDNGVGFDMAYVDKLFSAFQRLHSADEFPGTGIGLVTVKRIITRHGGQIWAEGEVGKGATFFFTLPE